MSQKQKLSEILAKLKAWAGHSGNDELDQHLNELENEINQFPKAQSAAEDDPPGQNNPNAPDIP